MSKSLLETMMRKNSYPIYNEERISDQEERERRLKLSFRLMRCPNCGHEQKVRKLNRKYFKCAVCREKNPMRRKAK